MLEDLSVANGTLIYVDMKIRDKSVVTMVDACTTDTFMASKIVQAYGPVVTTCAMRIKAVNSAVQPTHGIALDVPLTIGH